MDMDTLYCDKGRVVSLVGFFDYPMLYYVDYTQ